MQSRILGAACALASLFSVAGLAEAGLVVPTDLLPGDQYHVIFVSTTLTTATSSDINTYDSIVQTDANTAGIGDTIGLDGWKSVVSTPTVAARTHIATLFSSLTDVPIYNQNGERVANSYNDLWDGSILVGIKYDASGDLVDFGTHSVVWTGTSSNGFGSNYRELGATLDGKSTIGGSTNTNSYWIQWSTASQTDPHALFALSPEITKVVPVPAATWLFGSGLLGLVGISRRRKAG